MRRREMMQMLLGAAGTTVSLPGLAEGHPLQSHLTHHARVAEADAKAQASDWTREFLTEHDFKTVEMLAERIVPGASKARTAQFIDQLLAVDTYDNQRDFLNALGAFERRALARTARPYNRLTAAEQDELLTEASTLASGMPIEQPWAPGRPAEVAEPAGEIRLTLRDQFELLKGWVSGAYYSSEIGMRELGWTGNVFHNSFPGCQHPGGHP
jgi:Gluconate 2-dehydrogenase subunit 3